MVYAYRKVLKGFAAKLTVEQVKEMKEKSGVISVWSQRVLSLHTTLNFLRLQIDLGIWRGSNYGKGIIVGVLKQVLLPIILPKAILAWALHQKNGKANVKLHKWNWFYA
jgi:hypothetical protein